MNLKGFYQQLAIPDNCYRGKRIYKKLLYDNSQLSKSDQQRFSEQVDTLECRYMLDSSTLNIPKYVDELREYLEIAVIQVNLKSKQLSDSHRAKLAEILQRAIPYPLVLLFVYEQKIAVQLACKRINQADKSKLTLERGFDTGWIDLQQPESHQQAFLSDFVITHCSTTNLYKLYQDLVNRIVALNCAEISGQYQPSKNTAQTRQAKLDQFRSHQQQVSQLRTELNSETRFNRKVELNMQIKQLEKHLQSLKQQL